MAKPTTLTRDISPPPTRKVSVAVVQTGDEQVKHEKPKLVDVEPTLAAIEAGQARIRDHLEYFAKHFSNASRSTSGPRMSIDGFRDLYKRNQHPQGRHFVIHQHDHPISGVHYDLRVQVSDTSTISFAIPYGLPGDPNSIRPNRMAIETRVHNLWNNLIESASHATGSLLIWDTGEYEILERPAKRSKTTDDELSDLETSVDTHATSQSERLFAAFQSRHMHIRLHGQRLPTGYTIAMRLPRQDAAKQPRTPRIKRRRMDPTQAVERARRKAAAADTDSDSDMPDTAALSVASADDDAALASDAEDAETDSLIRATNAYLGATNSIGSIHQRHWLMTLDRKYSGFSKGLKRGSNAGRWVGPWEPFYVLGREHERSVITGRLADDVMADECVEGFAGRKMWRPIVE